MFDSDGLWNRIEAPKAAARMGCEAAPQRRREVFDQKDIGCQ